MWNSFQNSANRQNARVVRSQNIPVGQRLQPGVPFQEWADNFNDRVIDARNPMTPNTPVANLLYDKKVSAKWDIEQNISRDNLILQGLSYVRPSGSFARTLRVRGLGADPAPMDVAASCEGFDYQKWVEPIAAFIYSHPDFLAKGQPSDQTTADATARFGAPQVTCVLYGLAMGKVSKFEASQLARLQEAGAKMREKGWWEKENWSFYWTYLSGWTPFYMNPIYLGGAGAVALGAWWFLRKRKRR